MKGLLNINKPKDWTSFDVVNFVRHKLKIKQVGHLGTLDPMATGVLVVTVGSATKIFDMFLNKSKTYVAEFEFGYLTDTLDATGKVVKTTQIVPTLKEIENILPQFVGDIMQLPPKYSAKKVNGQKACDVARNGKEIELKPCQIHIEKLSVLCYKDQKLKLEIECGAGTYIRAIGRDIAEKLNSIATMTSLVRTKVGDFELRDSIEISNQTDNIKDNLLPLDIVFEQFDIVDDEQLAFRLVNGQTVKTDLKQGKYRLYVGNEFVAICEVDDGKIKMKKYFA